MGKLMDSVPHIQINLDESSMVPSLKMSVKIPSTVQLMFKVTTN